jgi:hypothetical protein
VARSFVECSIALVKRLLALVVGVFGLRALLRRRSQPLVYGGGASSPADELRTRLAESRGPAGDPTGPEAAQPETGLPSEVDERRLDVHDRARGAIDELKS